MNIKSNKDTLNIFPSKQIVKRMGLSNDQDGIMKRYVNEEGNWNSHLANTKNYIKDLIEKRSPKVVSIMGSGWLLDVPIDYLISNCEKIILLDIRHPKPIINRYKRNPKIEFNTVDLTGGLIEYTYNAIKEKNKEALIKIPEALINFSNEIDYVFSVNLLNQLDILIVEYIIKHKLFSDNDIYRLRKKIQTNHLNSLPKNKSAIITDYEEILFDRTGLQKDSRPLLFTEFPCGTNNKKWIWKFDTKMMYYPNRITHFKVNALEL